MAGLGDQERAIFGHHHDVLTGLLSVLCGFAIGALAVYQYRIRESTIEAERWLFRGRVWDWKWFWALRRANPVIVSGLFAVLSVVLIVNGFIYLLG